MPAAGHPLSPWPAGVLVAEGVVDDISHEGLRLLLREEGVSFQVIKTWKQSTDPCFEAKKNRILHLYGLMDDPTTSRKATPTWSSAWTSSGRSTCSRLLAATGRPGVVVARCRADGGGRPTPAPRGAAPAGRDMSRDRLYGHIKPRKRRGEFLVFCRYLRTLYPPGVRLGSCWTTSARKIVDRAKVA